MTGCGEDGKAYRLNAFTALSSAGEHITSRWKRRGEEGGRGKDTTLCVSVCVCEGERGRVLGEGRESIDLPPHPPQATDDII